MIFHKNLDFFNLVNFNKNIQKKPFLKIKNYPIYDFSFKKMLTHTVNLISLLREKKLPLSSFVMGK